jgi:ankyrin repeat protein
MDLNQQIQTPSNPNAPNPQSTPAPLQSKTSTAPSTVPPPGKFSLIMDEFLRAAESGDTITMDYLLAKGMDINGKGNMSRTPLMIAAQAGNMKSVEFLIKNNADLNVKNIAERTALHFAVDSDNPNPKLVARLIEAGANPNIGDNFGRTPMMVATQKPFNTQLIEVLIQKGADINAVDGSGATALMHAAWNKNGAAVGELIYNSADITKADERGQTALMATAQVGDPNVSQSMFGAISRMPKKDRPAVLNAQDKKGMTALMYAADNGNKFEVKQLLRFHPNLNVQDKSNKTALMHAVQKGDVATVRTLVEAGAKIGIESKPGETALTMAKEMLKKAPANKQLQEMVTILEHPTKKP